MTGPHRITLLTQEDCHLCEQAKEVLARVAADHVMEVEVISLASNTGQTLARKAGFMFAPGVLVDGVPFGFGRLSERKLRKALTKAGSEDAPHAVDGRTAEG